MHFCHFSNGFLCKTILILGLKLTGDKVYLFLFLPFSINKQTYLKHGLKLTAATETVKLYNNGGIETRTMGFSVSDYPQILGWFSG
jgi:hypothetical protein